ncbi:sentrin-specific protease 6 isoform X4 [Sinocyclocheilus rhinocerous]|uniref:sentrin-specific protease 6 isoform X4 n=1 Tax=Sinocyclocheilus rhinocerous TaxID=307959 RepID=UPI0007B803D5|nr:PREDICTED: sentrin-specific protease 6-like isoform X4 [Sinocyclocheilus rhinocerous]
MFFLIVGQKANSEMVRSFGQDRKNISKIKPLKRNAAGLQLLGMRTILTDQSDSEVKTTYTRCFEQPFKRFSYALQSTWRSDTRKHLTNNPSVDMLSSNEEKETRNELDTQYEDLFSFADTDLFVGQKKTTFKNCEDTSTKKQLLRKYRMRDEFGNIIRRVGVKNSIAKKAILPKSPKRRVAQWLNSLTLNIRCFKVGMLTKNFRRSDALTAQCTFTVDYIEIANKERIEASDLMGCEWCTEQKLPALFLQTTPETCLHLQVQLDMFEDDSKMWCDCQSRNETEKYVVLIFEKELTLSEQIVLEEIFTEMGKRNNISCFPAKLSFEKASNRLKTHQCAQKQEHGLVPFSASPDPHRWEIAALSVSDSDEDDLIELPSSPKQDIKKLVVYPPPPAKGGIAITEDDLNCLEEGEFLNDVIIDFYLRYLVCEQHEKEDASKCHVFSSFFFKRLTQKDHRRLPGTTDLSIQERRHSRVKTWTRGVNLFEKELIFVPINQMAHWYLAVICFPAKISQTSGLDLQLNGRRNSVEYLCDQSPPNPMSLFYFPESSKQLSRWSQSIDKLDQSFCFLSDDEAEDDDQTVKNRSVLNSASNVSKRPCILIMDSLTCSGRSSVVQILQEYLQEEWKVKMGSEQSFGNGVMDGWSPIVPKQDNYTDCGIFLLQYVESFLKDPPQSFHRSMDLNGWFSQRTVKRKRRQIKRLILRLHRQQKV